MRERWGTDRVAALAPDPASVKAALGLATPVRWEVYGADERAVWGMCGGSGKQPYRTTVDLDGPAFSCSCPSRKFPCKHALALLLLWASNLVPEEPAAPAFAADWLKARDSRPARTAEPRERDEEAAAKRAAERHRRVGDGLAELERWLRDRVRTGLAHAAGEGYAPVEQVAARMVDAQAPGIAGMVRRSAATPASGSGWPGRLLGEYARMRLLVRAYEQVATLPPELAATVRSRVGFTVARDDVLAAPGVRDRWIVVAVRDAFEGKVDTRRVWLRGAATGRWALVLLFAAGGAELGSHPDAVLLPGTALDAELHHYPGRPPLRALIGSRHGELGTAGPPAPTTVDALLDGYATALADDPWLAEWPAVLRGVPVEDGTGWQLRCADGVVPLAVSGVDVWPLVATSGGSPVTVAGEWTGSALRPLTCWHRARAVRL
ncbi:SWIM zinc finger family protein [Pseudonocardia sp. CA-107938]|uniref:SWIM zinc finger family protein n=1 Tax=Pseudonocardia sp. CA-107938 TaxID=3240021 RepID=UPI003D91C401